MSAELKILTYNIHKGFSPGKFKFSLPKMRQGIEAMNTDVVFLQEVLGEHKRHEKRRNNWPLATQFEFIAEQLWPHTAYGKNAIYEAGHHGNAILSKYPFMIWENIDVSNISRASRSLLHGVIRLPNVALPIHVLCIHFGLFKAERKEQLIVLGERIQQMIPLNEPLVIAGDFNDWRSDAMQQLEVDLRLQEVFKQIDGEYAKTFPAWRPTWRTDRIYFRELDLLEGECLNQKPWRTLSDHLPLYAKFSLAQQNN